MIKKRRWLGLVILAVSLIPKTVWSVDGIAVTIGDSTNVQDAEVYRVAVQWDWDKSWFNDLIEGWHLTGMWEASYNFWTGEPIPEHTGDTHHSIHVAAISPVFLYEQKRDKGWIFYIEAGIGFALLSGIDFIGRDMSSVYQFEDRLGFGIRFGERQQNDINLRLMHYSNAEIQKPNRGFDSVMLTFARKF